jgi:hypothetical protein
MELPLETFPETRVLFPLLPAAFPLWAAFPLLLSFRRSFLSRFFLAALSLFLILLPGSPFEKPERRSHDDPVGGIFLTKPESINSFNCSDGRGLLEIGHFLGPACWDQSVTRERVLKNSHFIVGVLRSFLFIHHVDFSFFYEILDFLLQSLACIRRMTPSPLIGT